MENTRLHQLCILAESRSLREAANKLNMTPGALSKSIKQLEDDLGAELFDRSKQKMEINSHGKKVYYVAQKITHEYRNLKNSLKADLPLRRIWRIGTYSTFSTYFLGRFLKRNFPDSQTFVKPLLPGDIEASLLNRSIDIGITSFPTFHEMLSHVEVGTIRMSIYGRKDIYGLKKFEDLPFCIPQFSIASYGNPNFPIDGWPSEFVRNPKYYFNSLETSLEVSRQGLAVGFYPDFVVDIHNNQVQKKYQLQKLHLPKGMKKVSLPIYLALREGEVECEFHDSLKKELAGSR